MDEKVCMRCRGRKKIYRVMGNCYTLENTGGILVDCPMCLGEGKIKTVETVMEEITAKKQRNYKKGEGHANKTQAHSD